MKRIPDYCEIFFPLKKVQLSFGPHTKTQARKDAKFFLKMIVFSQAALREQKIKWMGLKGADHEHLARRRRIEIGSKKVKSGFREAYSPFSVFIC
jgi:hypothetical protein